MTTNLPSDTGDPNQELLTKSNAFSVTLMEGGNNKYPLQQSNNVSVSVIEKDLQPEETLNNNNNDDDDNDTVNNETVGIDASNQRVACVVHVALVFFTVLVGVSVVLVFSLVQQFGLLALVLTSILVMAVVGLAFFLDGVMKEDKKWKPLRKTMRHWQAVTKAVLVQEFKHFQLDWNAYLLLTDGKLENDANVQNKEPKQKQKKEQRSILFRLVKPLLRIRNMGRRKKDKATVKGTAHYDPPVM